MYLLSLSSFSLGVFFHAIVRDFECFLMIVSNPSARKHIIYKISNDGQLIVPEQKTISYTGLRRGFSCSDRSAEQSGSRIGIRRLCLWLG